MKVERIEKPDWGPDHRLNAEIAELVAPSYVDASGVLQREFARCDLLYFARSDNGQLATFFMVARDCWHIDGRDTPAVYLGLSATNQETKGSGIVRETYRTFITEAAGWERVLGRPLVLWGTTATPSAYHAVDTLFTDLQPRPDGSFDTGAGRVADSLRGYYGLAPVGVGGHPFVMHGVASGTRYSDAESTRIRSICRTKQFTLFDDVEVDERLGDRLLLVCRLPTRIPQ